MVVHVTDFEWDDGNINHLAEHGIALNEAEEAVYNKSYVGRTRQKRLVFLGDMEEVTDDVVVARPKKRLLSFRIDDEVVERLQKLAQRKGIGYQTLMRVWVMERLEEEEKRAG